MQKSAAKLIIAADLRCSSIDALRSTKQVSACTRALDSYSSESSDLW
jgi:hypothetical protein